MGDAVIRLRIADDGACVQVGAAVGLEGQMLAPTLRLVILACRFSLALASTLALAACTFSATSGDDPAHGDVHRYCERFAAAASIRLIESPGASYVAGSSRVARERFGAVATLVSNVFHPRDSRFVGAWRCTFSMSANAGPCMGEVALLIAEHAEFAEYTSWPRLAIIDGNRIATAGGETIGYVTPKYLDTSCPG